MRRSLVGSEMCIRDSLHTAADAWLVQFHPYDASLDGIKVVWHEAFGWPKALPIVIGGDDADCVGRYDTVTVSTLDVPGMFQVDNALGVIHFTIHELCL